MKYRCESCSAIHLKWAGKCNCGEWNSLVEIPDIKNSTASVTAADALVFSRMNDEIEFPKRINTSMSEFDRAIGGGLVPGGVILISGDPGVGKSTLLLQISNSDFGKKCCVYISGEESVFQIKLRAKRLGINDERNKINLSASNNLEEILATITMHKKEIALVIIDSIQTIASDNLDGGAGSVGQIRYCAQKLIEFAKLENICVIIVGHVTKEGTIAGPKLLEHSVDTVLHFEGERNYAFRVLRCIKNRFGPTDEMGIFEIKEDGLNQVDNPSIIFLNQQQEGATGSIIFPSMEGSRPLMIEIQSLVSTSFLQMPRRAVIGWDNSRLPMICAVLEKHCKISFGNKDVYLNVMGGLRINEPAADLAVMLAILSSYLNIPLPLNYVAFGEVGLSGEIRSVQHTIKRINEATKLSCKGILTAPIKEKHDIIQLKNIQEVLVWIKSLKH